MSIKKREGKIAKLKLPDQLRQVMRIKYMSTRSEETYVDRIKRFIVCHGKRHRSKLGEKAKQALSKIEGRNNKAANVDGSGAASSTGKDPADV